MPTKSKPLAVSNPILNQVHSLGLSKEDITLIFVLPSLRSLGLLLAAKDQNSTGRDDEAAAAISYAIDRLEKYLMKEQKV